MSFDGKSVYPSDPSKRDKKRHQILSRLVKLDQTLYSERDHFYRNLLAALQASLASLHQGSHPEYARYRHSLHLKRDFNLTQLRLWHNYQVSSARKNHASDVATAKANHARFSALIKDKLRAKLEQQIRTLKEEKLIHNLVSANSWGEASRSDINSSAAAEAAEAASALTAAAAASNLHLAPDRRSLRRREQNFRFGPGDPDDCSDTGHASTTNAEKRNILASLLFDAASGKRRRHYATRYLLNDELSSGVTTGLAVVGSKNGNRNGNGSSDTWSDKDYDDLAQLIMEPHMNGISLLASDQNTRQSNRGPGKQFTGVQGLKPEELQDDLQLLKSGIENGIP